MSIGRRRKSEVEHTFNAHLGGLLAQVRESKGIVAKELAFAVGVTSAQLYNYEAGINAIPVFFLQKFCAYLDVPLAELVQVSSYCRFSKKRCAQCLTRA